jgi:hypothetical protein
LARNDAVAQPSIDNHGALLSLASNTNENLTENLEI